MHTLSALRLISVPVTILACSLAGCTANEGHKSAAGATHWSYEGKTGPAHWSTLSPEYALCAAGKSQSPINIHGQTSADLANIEFNYQPTPVEIINNGHTIQVNYAPGSFIVLDGVRYNLAQFHFHSPSEHTLNGDHAEAEIHLVHKSDAGVLAVVGVMIERGAHNASFDPVWANLPRSAGPAIKTNATVNAASLLPADPRTIRYEGSLTTPPGTEGVRWSLMVEPVHLSDGQLNDFRRIINNNNRPVQPLHGRTILQDSTK